jgi:hypothetical protein
VSATGGPAAVRQFAGMQDPPPPRARDSVRAALAAELRHFWTLKASTRPWQMPLAAALASGLPLVVAAALGELAMGLPASLGGLVFLYVPSTSLSHRMGWLMACAFGMAASYWLGLLTHLAPALQVPAVALVALLSTMAMRFHSGPPPGGIFFVMAAAIASATPAAGHALPMLAGLFTLGTVLAVLLALAYSLLVVTPRHAPAPPRRDFESVVVESVLISVFVGLSLALAHLLGLTRPYWVAITCLGVIQQASLRAAWSRQLQRIAGTGVGLLVFWGFTQVPVTPWTVALAILTLTFLIESLVVRHYALAVVFITPLALLLAESADLSHGLPAGVMQARFLDTLVGCAVALAGAACLHSPALRARIGRPLHRLLDRQGRA